MIFTKNTAASFAFTFDGWATTYSAPMPDPSTATFVVEAVRDGSPSTLSGWSISRNASGLSYTLNLTASNLNCDQITVVVSVNDATGTGAQLSTQLGPLVSDTFVKAILTAQGYTTTRATKLDNADVATSTRASATDYTSTRAAKLDNLDAAVTTRQSGSSAVTLPAIPTNWITAAGITASALNGKGDWLAISTLTDGNLAMSIASLTVGGPINCSAFGAAGGILVADNSNNYSYGILPGGSLNLSTANVEQGVTIPAGGVVIADVHDLGLGSSSYTAGIVANLGGNVIGKVIGDSSPAGQFVAAMPTSFTGDGTQVSKAGYKLAADGLDSISTTSPTGPASNFREMLVQLWRRFFKKATLSSGQLKTYSDDGTTVVTTQSASDSTTNETQGPAS